MHLYRHAKDLAFSSFCSRDIWLKNLAIWLVKSYLMERNQNFPKYEIYSGMQQLIQTFISERIEKKMKELRKKNCILLYIQRTLGLAYFPHFEGKTLFSKDLTLSFTTPHGPLTPCWVPEKTREAIPRKIPNRRTNRPYS